MEVYEWKRVTKGFDFFYERIYCGLFTGNNDRAAATRFDRVTAGIVTEFQLALETSNAASVTAVEQPRLPDIR